MAELRHVDLVEIDKESKKLHKNKQNTLVGCQEGTGSLWFVKKVEEPRIQTWFALVCLTKITYQNS